MPQKTYLAVILSCFTLMDIAGLRFFLKSEYSYQDTTKEIFLSKILKVFDSFSNSGDTELFACEGACEGKSCDNCGIKGYRFVGNHSKNYIDLLFVMMDDDIRDIFYCEQFKTDADLVGLADKNYIYINVDDRVKFYKSPEYRNKVFLAVNAYSELITYPPKKLDFIIACDWLEKHRDLNRQIGKYDILSPTMKWSLFSKLYDDVNQYMSYISHHYTEIIQACHAFIMADTDEKRISCIMKYKILFEEAPFDLKFDFIKEGDCYVPETENSFILVGEQFIQTFKFIDLYQENEQDLLEKYNTYTKEERNEAYSNHNLRSEESDEFSLRFHLARRKALEEIGIQLPFYLITD